MSKYTIYRIEWKDEVPEKLWGIGMFRFSKCWYPKDSISDKVATNCLVTMSKYNNSNFFEKVIRPSYDFKLFEMGVEDISNYIFGFTSITALKKCVGVRHLNNFLKAGFVVKKYEKCSDYINSISGLQCMFIPTKKGTEIDINAVVPVYRLEHIEEKERESFEINPNVCKGIYRDIWELSGKNPLLDAMFQKHNTGNTFPCGEQDFNDIVKYNTKYNKVVEALNIPFEKFFYGFNSTKQVNKWFTQSELKAMKAEGYVLKEFTEYEHVLNGKSNKQIIFIPKSKGVIV